ncbi:MAG: endonuclease domain-containing protein, partial [Polyangiaceae bacterium]
ATDPAPRGFDPATRPGPSRRSSCATVPSFHFRPPSTRLACSPSRANAMRHAPTASEARLFEALRGGRLGVAFRRQVPLLGRYIVDLLAHEVSLVVEVDGGYHAQRGAADARRDRALVRAGYGVLRIEAELVIGDLGPAVARVRDEVERIRGAQAP